jgi:uncharacterized protein GlcG (DUF336 family)
MRQSQVRLHARCLAASGEGAANWEENYIIKRTLTVALLAMAAPTAVWAEGMESKSVLSQTAAQSMVEACFADQKSNKYSNVNVFVVDDGGHLVAAARQDGACKACADIAKNIAITSALFAAPTRVMADLSFGKKNRDGVDAGLPGAAFVPGLVAFAGGLPTTTASGDVVGGIGVSGASSDEEEQCAQAGIDAIADLLK